jgi:hypothetical protein
MKLGFALAISALLVLSAAEARTRVHISTQPVSRSNAEIICPWTTGSVSPTWPQEQQKLYLGVCPPQASYR